MESKPRAYWLDALKVLSLFLVVCIHIIGYGVSLHPVGSSIWLLSNILDTIAHIAVPLFVMISGALLLDSSKDTTWRYIWRHRITRIAITVIFWSIVYALFNFAINSENVSTFVWRLLTGQNHLWFLFMIAVMYASVPLMADVANNPHCDYLIVLFLGLSIINTVPQYLSSNPICGWIGDLFASWASAIRFNPGYLGLFLLGRRLYVADCPKKIARVLSPLFIISAILAIVGTYYLSVSQGSLNEYFYQAGTLTTIFMSTSVFCFAKKWIGGVTSEKGLFQICNGDCANIFGHLCRSHDFRFNYRAICLWQSLINDRISTAGIYLVCSFCPVVEKSAKVWPIHCIDMLLITISSVIDDE